MNFAPFTEDFRLDEQLKDGSGRGKAEVLTVQLCDIKNGRRLDIDGARLLTRHFLKRMQNKFAILLVGLAHQAAEFV
jgi:hypothetical protein